MQRALIQYRKPENYKLVREALEKAGRQDLIGFDKKCLIKPYPPKASEFAGGKGASRGAGSRSGNGGASRSAGGRSGNGGASRGSGAGRAGGGRGAGRDGGNGGSASRGGGKGRSIRNGKGSSSKQ